ncbi:hypothetical protein [Corynebacterium coyleae]|uniref:hypothetical protein n=1 Tax=Corynebacterium coyleae TaxID=53374 RepID=UPI00255049D0|nr:hypothetical protein [Corynebacterium coyleae]MDK8242557.1 hypothetical protein [Corynebacterium coyleae]
MHATITAYLDTPVIGEVGMLDGPLSWAAWQQAVADGQEFPPMSDDYCHDFELGLHTWQRGDHWGWCTSRPYTDPVHHTAVEIRRRPPTGPMAIYTQAKEHHHGLGPLKARNVTLAATWHPTIYWHAEIVDETRVQQLLSHITHLGARHRNGHGHITRWGITAGPKDGWQDRPMPNPNGRPMRTRAPYWHPTERTPCD